MFVRNWMSTPVVIVPPVMRIREALDFMEERRLSRFPVVDAGRLVGIVARGDILAIVGNERPSRRGVDREVWEIMTRPPVTIAADETIEAASQSLLYHHVSCLPVLEDDRLVGILTASDILRAFSRLLGAAESGARIVLSVRDGEDLLPTVARQLDGLAVRSLVTLHDPEAGRWDVVLRVRGRSAARQRAPSRAGGDRA